MSGFNNFSAIGDSMHKQLSALVMATAFNIQSIAQQLAPVDTGALKASIATQPGENDLEAYVVVGVDYGIYVEFGTYKMIAQPFLTPAVEAVRGDFESALAGLKWEP